MPYPPEQVHQRVRNGVPELLTPRGWAEQGSWAWSASEHTGGPFSFTLCTLVEIADQTNRELLRLGYPQLVAAFEWPDHLQAPPGYPRRPTGKLGDRA